MTCLGRRLLENKCDALGFTSLKIIIPISRYHRQSYKSWSVTYRCLGLHGWLELHLVWDLRLNLDRSAQSGAGVGLEFASGVEPGLEFGLGTSGQLLESELELTGLVFAAPAGEWRLTTPV